MEKKLCRNAQGKHRRRPVRLFPYRSASSIIGEIMLPTPMLFHRFSAEPEKKKMSGQSAVFTHSILLGFTIFLIFVIITTFTTIRGDFQEFVAQNEMNQICFAIRAGFEKVYQQPDYVSPAGTKNTLTIRLPDKLADASYRVSFVNRTVKIQTLGPLLNSTCNIGFNTSYSGHAVGGMIEVSYSLNTTASVIGMRGL